MPRINSDTTPCVGAGMLCSVPSECSSRRGSRHWPAWAARSASRTGLPSDSRSRYAARQVAAIEILDAGVCKPLESRGEPRLAKECPRGGGRAVREIRLVKPRLALQALQL